VIYKRKVGAGEQSLAPFQCAKKLQLFSAKTIDKTGYLIDNYNIKEH